MRQKEQAASRSGVPAWMVTYTDVITLLMTFFVLLLTFATDQPEDFDKMRSAIFGDNFGGGIAGRARKEGELDSVLWRERSLAGRLPQRGSEMPPLHSDPSLTAVAEGLGHLDNPTEHSLSESHSIKIPLAFIFQADGRLTIQGTKLLSFVAKNVRHLPHDLQIQVSATRHLDRAIAIAQHLVAEESLTAGRIGVGVRGTTLQMPVIWLQLKHTR